MRRNARKWHTNLTGSRVTLDVAGIQGARHGALYAYLEDVEPR